MGGELPFAASRMDDRLFALCSDLRKKITAFEYDLSRLRQWKLGHFGRPEMLQESGVPQTGERSTFSALLIDGNQAVARIR
jgi:hypothetical protein